jgi:D-amino-acid dehydrogenase
MAEFLVLGAGMVGTTTALALQAQGHAVRLLDASAPGQETSMGNAGVIQAEARAPYAFPRDPRQLLGYALGQSNDLLWSARTLPTMARALWAYFRASAPHRLPATVAAYAQLIAQATTDHGALIRQAGPAAEALLRRTGLGEIYADPRAFDARQREAMAFAQTHGLSLSLRDSAALTVEDPAIRASAAGAMIWQDSHSLSDPAALTSLYAGLFTGRGGSLIRDSLRSLTPAAAGWQANLSSGSHLQAEQIVLALGPWSPHILRPLGYRVPMVYKRGYHHHYAAPTPLSRPYVLAEHGVVLSSMARGLRMTTGAHLAALNAPRDLRQIRRGQTAAATLVEIGDPLPEAPWHGTRPCLPRMLPMIGQAPRHRGLWLNFGHGHQGLTLGPTSARLLAEIIDGRQDALTRALAP